MGWIGPDNLRHGASERRVIEIRPKEVVQPGENVPWITGKATGADLHPVRLCHQASSCGVLLTIMSRSASLTQVCEPRSLLRSSLSCSCFLSTS